MREAKGFCLTCFVWTLSSPIEPHTIPFCILRLYSTVTLSLAEISDEVHFCSVTPKGLVAWLPLPISCLRNSTAMCSVAACRLINRKMCTNTVCDELMGRRTYERIPRLYFIWNLCGYYMEFICITAILGTLALQLFWAQTGTKQSQGQWLRELPLPTP